MSAHVLPLKRICTQVSSYFDHSIGASDVPSVEQIDKGHGRIETRRIHVLEDIGWFEDRKRWRGLKTFVAIERERIVDDKATYERAEFLCSLPSSAIERIARAARAHWSVENQLHWSLDMTFGEDASRIRDRNGATHFACCDASRSSSCAARRPYEKAGGASDSAPRSTPTTCCGCSKLRPAANQGKIRRAGPASRPPWPP